MAGVRERSSHRDDETLLDSDEMTETYWHVVEQDDPSIQPFEVHRTNGPQNSAFG